MILKRILSLPRAVHRYREQRLPNPTPLERHAINNLRERIGNLPVIDVAAATSPAHRQWLENRLLLRKYIQQEDPRKFLRWPVVRDTMFVETASYSQYELNALQSSDEWVSRWQAALVEDLIGLPPKLVGYSASSGNLIHHAYHLQRYEQSTGCRIPNQGTIVEFGGGYGSMCRLFHRLGFRGRYIIYDLPDFSELQRYFLHGCSIQVNEGVESGKEGVFLLSSLERLKEVLQDVDLDMFIGTWSISETSMEVRNGILPLVSAAQAFLLAYQEHFGEMDNVSFFASWTGLRPDVVWKDDAIGHLPLNRYLFGHRE